MLTIDYRAVIRYEFWSFERTFMNANRRQTTVAVVAVVLIGVLYFCIRPAPVEADSGFRLVMGTFARVVCAAPDANAAKTCIKAAIAEIHKVDGLMSDYKDDSEISIVNREAFGRAVAVSRPTFEVLRRAVEFSSLSGGAFDITIGPLVDLWRAAGEANRPPTEAELLAARARVGSDKLILDANNLSVRFLVEKMRLDLGGIAKGYAIDRAAETMIENGATGGMVDIGGDIRCFGSPAAGRDHWRIGLQDPKYARDEIGPGKPLLVLKLKNTAVATSGGYRRFALVEGKRHSHIIDTRTGQSSERLTSVTIIAPDAITADALATAVSVLGAEKGLELIEKLPRTEAIIIPSDEVETLVKTAGAEAYIK